MTTARVPTAEPDTAVDPTSSPATAGGVGELLDRGMRRGTELVDEVRRRLPAPVPVYLGIGALALTGLVSWPVAVAAGCGFAAFRHWEPQASGMPMSDHR